MRRDCRVASLLAMTGISCAPALCLPSRRQYNGALGGAGAQVWRRLIDHACNIHLPPRELHPRGGSGESAVRCRVCRRGDRTQSTSSTRHVQPKERHCKASSKPPTISTPSMTDVLESYGRSGRLYLSPAEREKQLATLGECAEHHSLPGCVRNLTGAQGHRRGRTVAAAQGDPRSDRAPGLCRYTRSGSDGAGWIEAMAAAGHRDRSGADRERTTSGRVSGVRRDRGSPAGASTSG